MQLMDIASLTLTLKQMFPKGTQTSIHLSRNIVFSRKIVFPDFKLAKLRLTRSSFP